MAMSETYARGLTRRAVEPLIKSTSWLPDRVEAGLAELLDRRARNLDRKMRPRDFAALRDHLQRLGPHPAVLATDGLPARASGKNQTAGIRYAISVEMTRRDAITDTAIHDEVCLHVFRALFLSDGKRFNAYDWLLGSQVSQHALRRYVLREAGEAVTSEDFARLIATAASYAALYIRLATLNTFDDMPSRCIAPFGNGFLLGYITRCVNPPRPRHIVRDKNGVRTLHAHDDDFLQLSVAWRTFIARDMLNPTQQATVAEAEGPLLEAQAALAADPRIADAMPFPGQIPTLLHQRAREAMRPFMRVWRSTGAAGFTYDFPEPPRAHPVDTEAEDADQARARETIAANRALIWPDDIAGSIRRTADKPEMIL